MAKKTIGIPGWKLGDNSFGATITYLGFISKFGNPKILLPTDNGVCCDVLLLPGGPDVSPFSFGEAPGYHTGNACVHRQGFFERELKHYIDANIPIFGICLGFQMLNVFFGGGLTQDLPAHKQSEGRYKPGHSVTSFPNNICNIKKGKDMYPVNSHHHQGVTMKDISPDFNPIAYAENEENSENPIVEAFVHKSLNIAGVQWHPKFFGTC